MKKKAVVLSSGIYMFIDWSLASLEWTLVLYLYMIPGPQLPGLDSSAGFQLFPAISGRF